MDEASMTDVYSLAEVIEAVDKAKAKLILIGDDAQLQPIGPGAPFRALLERIGFAELQCTVRQDELWQRQATHQFASGQTRTALTLYQAHHDIYFGKNSKDAMHQLIDDWQNKQIQENICLSKMLLLAHQNKDVVQLNQIARAKRIMAGEIDRGSLVKQNGHEIWLSPGDRLLFLKNDSKLEVKNGQFGTVMEIKTDDSGESKSITVELDNKKQVVFNPEKYAHLTHGYAATIHKAQGVTTDHSFIYVGGDHWNRNLMYVAASRHRKSLHIYVDQEKYVDFDTFASGVERKGLKDNVIDYPLSFAVRRGLENESLFQRFKAHALEYLKSMNQFLREKYQQWFQQQSLEKTSAVESDKKLAEQSALSKENISLNEVNKIQASLGKLHHDLIQAKEQRDHYAVYRLRKQLHQEFKAVHQNKKLSQTIQMKSPQLFKELQHSLQKQHQYEIE